MNIKKIYNYFFYLNTGAKSSGKETTIISSFEAFVILVIFAILKKGLFSKLKTNSLFVFACFLVIVLVLNYFNKKVFKRRNSEFARQCIQELKSNKIAFKVYNVIFIIITFFMSIYMLSYFD